MKKLSVNDLLAVFEGVPQVSISKPELEQGINVLDLLAVKSNVLPSKGEARRTIKGGGVSINRVRLQDTEEIVSSSALLQDKFILVQRGKKNYFLLCAE